MIELGKKQKLTVVKSVDFGVYLGEDMQADAKNRVLLPSRQVPEGTKEGDSIEAFIYKDSQDRLIATTKEPKLQVGQTAVLKGLVHSLTGDWRKTFCFHIMNRL